MNHQNISKKMLASVLFFEVALVGLGPISPAHSTPINTCTTEQEIPNCMLQNIANQEYSVPQAEYSNDSPNNPHVNFPDKFPINSPDFFHNAPSIQYPIDKINPLDAHPEPSDDDITVQSGHRGRSGPKM